MTEEEIEQNREESRDRRWPLWWVVFPIFLVLSLSACGYLYYKYYKSTHDSSGKSYKALYDEVEVKYNTEKASLMAQIEEFRVKLDEAERRNADYLVENSGLKDQLDAAILKAAKKVQSAGAGNPKALREAQKTIDELTSLRNDLEANNSKLTAQNTALLAQIKEKETERDNANSRARAVEEQKEALDEKIKSGTSLNVTDLKVVGVRKKGSTEEESFKASKIDRLKITFTILANELVEAGNKDVIVRLIGTNKEVLTNENPSLTDTDKLSTLVQTIEYQNEPIKTTIFYTQKPSYKKGTYTIELIHNDKLMGRASFILK